MKSSKFANQLRENAASREFVDLHMHSTFSDGALEVRELIDFCRDQGLSAIAVTDHDNIDSFEEGREYAQEKGIEYIPGVEISSSIGGSDIHILGYLFDPTHLKLNKTLLDLRAKRKDRARQIVERLEEKGVSITYESVLARAQGGSVGRAHIVAQLLEEEFVATFQDAFTKYLGKESDLMAELDTVKLTPAEAIELIISAGGVPALAHPSKTNRDDLLEHLVECGPIGRKSVGEGK